LRAAVALLQPRDPWVGFVRPGRLAQCQQFFAADANAALDTLPRKRGEHRFPKFIPRGCGLIKRFCKGQAESTQTLKGLLSDKNCIGRHRIGLELNTA